MGDEALRSRATDPRNTISSAKRLIGRYYSEIADTVPLFGYEVVPDSGGAAAVRIGTDLVAPEEVASEILRSVCDVASERLGEPVEGAVVGIPAYFTQRQRDATRRAVQLAGVRLDRLIIEPVAASLFYNWTSRRREAVSVVVDLGGGTYDVTVLGYGGDVSEVLAVNGDRLLGGNDFDERVIEFVSDRIEEVYRVRVDRNDPIQQQRLLDACTAAKCDLSESDSARVLLPYWVARDGSVQDLSVEIGRADFDVVCAELFERLRSPVIDALASAGVSPDRVQSVMFVGSATRMKRVHSVVREILPDARFRFANPGEAVALGAAVQAGILEGSLRHFVHIDAIPFSIGVEDEDGRTHIIIPANTRVPVSRSIWLTNAVSDQATVEAHLLQGGSEVAADNVSLARVVLDGVPAVPRGLGTYRLDVDIDVSCDMRVTLSDPHSGLAQSIAVTT